MLKKVGRALLLGAVVLSANALAGATPKTHRLAATSDTVQWGWLDPKEPPKLTVNSGDTVSVETMMHAHDKIQPGTTMEEIVALRKANPGGGPHSMTGPHLRQRRRARRRDGDPHPSRSCPRRSATNFNLPGQGVPHHRRARARDARRLRQVLRPRSRRSARRSSSRASRSTSSRSPARSRSASIPTTRRRARAASTDPMAPVSTLRPWKNGSNMDINELQAGATIFIPIFLKGGLVWTGDSHCRQGNGEVNLTALECSYREIVHPAHRAQGHEARAGRASRPRPTGSRSASTRTSTRRWSTRCGETVDFLAAPDRWCR